MKHLAAVILFLILASPAYSQTLTPQDARATLTVARAQATAASELATANAPMGLQREYTAAVKAWNKANGDVSRADAALKIAIAKAKKK